MTITLALPSKGRLKEEALGILKNAGLSVVLPKDQRNYRAQVKGESQIDILFLSASEIARELGYGSVDLGVTGEDLIRETLSSADERVQIEARVRLWSCGRGRCRTGSLVRRVDDGGPR